MRDKLLTKTPDEWHTKTQTNWIFTVISVKYKFAMFAKHEKMRK